MLTCNDRLLNRERAAELLAVRPQTLSAWICRGGGPPYIKVGRCVRYRLTDLERWLASRTVGAASGE